MALVHVRYDGQSHDIDANQLDVGIMSLDAEIKERLANYFEVPVTKFNSFQVDRNESTGDLTVRPNAVFG